MSDRSPFEQMDPEARAEFCREVMERLSDLVEDDAPEDLCARVAELMVDCQPFQAYRNTLERTIDLAAEVGRSDASQRMVDAEAFDRCIDRVRQRLDD